jgi:hypothetical protein
MNNPLHVKENYEQALDFALHLPHLFSYTYTHTYIHTYITLHSMDSKLVKMTVEDGISHTATMTQLWIFNFFIVYKNWWYLFHLLQFF